MKKETITVFQLGMIMMTSTGLLNHVIIIPLLLKAAGRDAWISVLLTTIVLLSWIFLIYYILKKTEQQNMFIWFQQKFGSIIAWPISILMSIFLYSLSFVTMKDTITWAKISYLPQMPDIILTFLLSIICFYLAHSGIRTISITTGLLLPFVVIFGFFVMTANFQHKDYSLLTPVLEHGINPVLRGMIYMGAGLVELLLLIFMHHHVQSKVNLLSLNLLGLILVMLTLGPLIGAITEFGPAAATDLRFPAFEEWRLAQLGRYIEHLDFLSIYQWLVGALIRISLTMFLIPDIFNLPKGVKRTWILVILFGSQMVLNVALPLNDIRFLDILYRYYLPWVLIFMTLLSLLISGMVFLKQRKKVV